MTRLHAPGPSIRALRDSRAVAAAPAADGVGGPLLPLLDRVRHLAVGVRLLPSALVVLARRDAQAGIPARLVDGLRHPPGRLPVAHPSAEGVRRSPGAARVRGIPAALRRAGAALRGGLLGDRVA